MDEILVLEKELQELEIKKIEISKRLFELRKAQVLISPKQIIKVGRSVSELIPKTLEEKVSLFLKLFRCREEVYPRLWTSKDGKKKGYSPVCYNEWTTGLCNKPKIKCTDCSHRLFEPLDANVIEAHLRGRTTVGTYAIREDDTCIFLACDFDEGTWQDDVNCYQEIGESLGLFVAVERSRSGKGAHAWIFFEEPVPARLARSLGTMILAKCSESRHRLSTLESYDRFFPNQDFIPKGGFGNLIALPLQRFPRNHENSVFIDKEGRAYSDQWAYLASVRRLSLNELRCLVGTYNFERKSLNTEEDDPSLVADLKLIFKKDDLQNYDLANSQVEIIQDGQLSISLEGLPSKLITVLKRTASFPNPEFYKLQRMRMATYPNPRIIFSGELRDDKILLPRGVLDRVKEIFKEVNSTVVIRDQRIKTKKMALAFKGNLRPEQKKALKEMSKYETGILCAPPGAGKTVMACSLIEQKKVPTLILVHRQPLAEQWKSRLSEFLEINPKEIGLLGGSKKKLYGKVDIAMIQTLVKIEEVEAIVRNYGMVIVDECHHIPAVSFEALLKRFPIEFVFGLTATPYRKDRLEKILFQQCGPIRFTMEASEGKNFEKSVSIVDTGFALPENLGAKPAYHLLTEYLVQDLKRNSLIVADIGKVISEFGFPLVISDRKNHLDVLTELLQENNKELVIFRLDGELSHKMRRETIEEIQIVRAERKKLVIMATGSFIGEGFDLPELDTLILATPLSFKGRIIQYAGRIHRLAEGKKAVRIFDYLDSCSPVFLKMYKNRLKVYSEMGYEVVKRLI